MARRPSSTLANAVAPGVRVSHIEPLQTRIDRNRWRFFGFMVAFTSAAGAALFVAIASVLTVLTLMVASAGERAWESDLFLMCIAFSLTSSIALSWIWALSRFSRSEVMLLNELGARMPKPGTLLPTRSALRDMAIAAGLPRTPQFYVIDVPGVNAFALGKSIETVRIGVTTGMLERICVDEQRAVFANLIARVISQDTRWATAVSALMGPIWAMREYDLRFEPRMVAATRTGFAETDEPQMQDWRAGLFTYGLAVVVTEILSWYHQEAAWKAAEKADAEGMMLLKDPRSMLRAIENVLERNNHVPSAGDAYSQIFFCWAGFGFAPEDDPEMRRVARLRETLGAEGVPYIQRPNVPNWNGPPVAPRLEFVELAVNDTFDASADGSY